MSAGGIVKRHRCQRTGVPPSQFGFQTSRFCASPDKTGDTPRLPFHWDDVLLRAYFSEMSGFVPALPNLTFNRNLRLHYGDVTIELLFLPTRAHGRRCCGIRSGGPGRGHGRPGSRSRPSSDRGISGRMAYNGVKDR